MTRRAGQIVAECVMVGAVLCATPFAIMFAVAAMVRGGLKPLPESKP